MEPVRFEVFINELLTSIHLLWVQWVCFGHFGDEGVFEVYGVVTGSLRREFPCFGFIKYLGILGILRGAFVQPFLLHEQEQWKG